MKKFSWLKTEREMRTYLFLIPFLACGPLLRENHELAGFSGMLGYGVAVCSVAFSFCYLYANRAIYWQPFVQSIKRNWLFIFLSLLMIISYAAKLWLGINAMKRIDFARVASYMLVGFLCIVLLPLLVAWTKDRFIYFAFSIGLVGFIVSCIALLATVGVPGFVEIARKGEMMSCGKFPSSSSVFFEQNIFGMVCAVSLCHIVYLLTVAEKVVWRVVLFFMLLVICSGLYLSWFRTAWISVCLFLFIYALSHKNARRIVFILVPIVTTVFGTVYFLVKMMGSDCSVESLLFPWGIENALTLSNRIPMWFDSLLIIKDSMIVGYGVGHKYLHAALLNMGHDHLTTHNVFLDYSIMHGVVSLVPFLLFFFVAMHRALFGGNFYRDPFYGFIAGFCVLAFVVIQISPHNLGGASFVSLIQTIYWGLAMSSTLKDVHAHRCAKG